MACEQLPCISYMALYIISMHIVNSNSRSSSSHWKLNMADGKVEPNKESQSQSKTDAEDDIIMSILTATKSVKNGHWMVESSKDQKLEVEVDSCKNLSSHKNDSSTDSHNKNQNDDHSKYETERHTNTKESQAAKSGHISSITSSSPGIRNKTSTLTCGKPVNSTQYDHLRGITSRHEHPHIPEPEVAMIFRKKGTRSSEVDLNDLEQKLLRLKKEKPKSCEVYNQIGNFWRIKGNTRLSIECFRRALSINPDHPDVLLNLARVLFNLQYLDDAISLTRRSLHMQPSEKNSWLQHFTLGEILKAYGHYQEATFHFKHALELNPGFGPAIAQLREMDGTSNPSVTQYTLFIIMFLVFGVLFGVITSMEGNFDDGSDNIKTQRHFNRAMAMRSIKLGVNHRIIRMRKLNY